MPTGKSFSAFQKLCTPAPKRVRAIFGAGVGWYNDQVSGLGLEFLDELDRAVRLLRCLSALTLVNFNK